MNQDEWLARRFEHGDQVANIIIGLTAYVFLKLAYWIFLRRVLLVVGF
jgi:hypothetical protein